MVHDLSATAAPERVAFRRGRLEGALVAEGGLRLEASWNGRALPSIDLGLQLGEHELRRSRILRARTSPVEAAWTATSGKSTGRLEYRHDAVIVELRHDDGLEWELELRVSHEGLAFRYAATALWGVSWIDAEHTRLSLPADGRAWVLDYQTWYETPRRGSDIRDLAPGDYGFPFLLRAGEAGAPYVLLTEADIDGRFSGAHAHVEEEGGLAIRLADERVEVARGPLTPWRVLVVGELSDIVASRFVDELAPDPRVDLAPVARPGRAAWSWWSDFYSGAQLEHQKRFVDRAAEFGWEHLLIDCGWEETWVPEIVAYASRRGIQVHLWVVWHDLDGPLELQRLALWRSWGVAGIKVDFMESESKDRYRWYDSILSETARLGLMVNFHGSVIPRGWVRTWPQVVGYEAIRGSEYYVFYQDTPLDAAHNVIQPFTRNVVGAMDYTPVALTAPGRTTSDGHELGLAVAFECGITHFADDVEVYAARPEVARALSELPPVWDETVLLAGTPDTEAVVARRSGDRWFVGAIATGAERTLRVPLDRLGGGAWNAWIIADGEGGGLRELRQLDVSELDVPIARDGGFFAVLARDDAELFRAAARPEGPAPRVTPARGELDAERSAVLTTSPDATLRTPPGWTAVAEGAGRWRVVAPAGIAPGALGVIAIEEARDEIPAIAHARLVAPLTPGEHVLSRLPMLSFRNESGPVERDMSNGGGNPADGIPMHVAGAPLDDGFGVSTPSSLELALDARATRVRILVGVDDETPGCRARGEIVGDGVVLASVDVASGEPARELDVDVTGVRTLELRTHPLGEGSPAHVDWAHGRLVVPSDLHITPDPGHR